MQTVTLILEWFSQSRLRGWLKTPSWFHHGKRRASVRKWRRASIASSNAAFYWLANAVSTTEIMIADLCRAHSELANAVSTVVIWSLSCSVVLAVDDILADPLTSRPCETAPEMPLWDMTSNVKSLRREPFKVSCCTAGSLSLWVSLKQPRPARLARSRARYQWCLRALSCVQSGWSRHIDAVLRRVGDTQICRKF